jgi:hypothetical protein
MNSDTRLGHNGPVIIWSGDEGSASLAILVKISLQIPADFTCLGFAFR